MKKLLIFMLCSLLATLHLIAQDNPAIKFGEVKLEDLQMKVYPKDSAADAVVLYDYGETNFDIIGNQLMITLVYHGRIKILKKSAYDRATITIPYYKGNNQYAEVITRIKGFTYNLENNQIKKESLTRDMIFNEKTSDNFHTQRFTLPNVVEGSIIEYTYEISSPFQYSHNPKTWTFQSSIPVAWSEYRITIPNSLYYRMIMSGYLGLHINENKDAVSLVSKLGEQGIAYRFVVKDAPAFKNEPYITTPADYLSKVDFELASINIPGTITKSFSLNWEDLNTTLLQSSDVGGQINRTNFLKDIAKTIKAEAKDTLQQVEAATNYIKKNIKWNGGMSIYCANLKKVLENKKGDAGDINLLLIGLLREMGYDANPFILSTRQHGRTNPSYAMLKQFNYVVAHIKVGGKDLLIDATDEFLKLGMLPVHCLNSVGWLVHPTDSRHISIVPTEWDREYEKADLTIGDEGELTGKFMKSYGGYSGWSAKTMFKSEGKDKFLETIKKGKPSWNITEATYKNETDVNATMEAHYQLTMSDYVTQAGDMMYLKPMLSEGFTENPLKATERLFPIDYGYPIEETFLATYVLPAGYKVVESPKPASVALPDNGGKFTYAIQIDAGKITISSRVQFRKPLYEATEYEVLKMFYDKIVAKHSEQIVLKKEN